MPAARGRLLNGLGIGIRTDIDQLARGHASLADREAREAFVHTLRSIVEPGGQRVSATDRLYLAENMPFLISGAAATRSSRSPMAAPRIDRCRAAASKNSPTPVTSLSWTSRSAS